MRASEYPARAQRKTRPSTTQTVTMTELSSQRQNRMMSLSRPRRPSNVGDPSERSQRNDDALAAKSGRLLKLVTVASRKGRM